MLQFLVFQVKTWIKSTDFQSKSELLTTENFLPFTDEVTVELVHKCIQQLHLLALHFEILGYIPGLLNGLEYLRRTGDLSGDNITRRLLWNILVLAKPWRLTEDADERFNGLNLTASIKVRKLLIELGIRTEDAECNLRGVKVIFNLFVIVIVVCKVVIPSREKRHSYRL